MESLGSCAHSGCHVPPEFVYRFAHGLCRRERWSREFVRTRLGEVLSNHVLAITPARPPSVAIPCYAYAELDLHTRSGSPNLCYIGQFWCTSGTHLHVLWASLLGAVRTSAPGFHRARTGPECMHSLYYPNIWKAMGEAFRGTLKTEKHSC